MAADIQVLPGDLIPPSIIPRSEKKQLKIGPGLQHTPPSTITATIPGTLRADTRKNALWVDYDGGRVSENLAAEFSKR